MQSDMPPNEYYELFKPDYSLFIKKDTAMRNENTALKVEKVRHGGTGCTCSRCDSCATGSGWSGATTRAWAWVPEWRQACRQVLLCCLARVCLLCTTR